MVKRRLIVFAIILVIFISSCAEEPVVERKPPEQVQEICQNECPIKERRCAVNYNNVYQECGNFDEDDCWEWGSLTKCFDDLYCKNGQCVDKIIGKEKVSEEKLRAPIQPKQETLITPSVPVQPTYVSPGDYSTITGVQPFLGNSDAQLKILFVKIGNAPYYNEIKSNVAQLMINNISPFKENSDSMAFYSVEISRDNSLNCGPVTGYGLGSSGFSCDNQAVYEKIGQQIGVSDKRDIITIGLVENEGSGSGGDIIYAGTRRDIDLEAQLDASKQLILHEIGHNFGLADLYYGMFYFDGRPSSFWEVEFSRSFLNVDGPGCPKWCNAYKPPSQYTRSTSAQCLSFTDRQQCVSFGRDSSGGCFNPGFPGELGNFPDCCVWSDEPFEYFGTNCVPALGSEDIGIDCLAGSGCYFGAVYGNYAWRPVLRSHESFMSGGNRFSSVEERELNKIFDCCLSNQDSSMTCTDFRNDYSDFLQTTNFKKRIGSCAHIS